MCKSLELDGVAVTEHSAWDAEPLISVMEKEGLVMLPSREVSCAGLHVLVITSDQRLVNNLGSAVTPDQLAIPGIACIWAHPAFLGGSGVHPLTIPPPGEVETVLHAVEVLNGQRLHMASGISRALETAEMLNLPGTGGSDAHRARDIGRCFTEIGCEADGGPAGIIEAIRTGRVRPVLSKIWADLNAYDYRSDLAVFLG